MKTKEPSLQDKIVALLEERRDWVPSYELEKASSPLGWIGTSGLVRARELERAGLIEKQDKGKYVFYRAKQKEPE